MRCVLAGTGFVLGFCSGPLSSAFAQSINLKSNHAAVNVLFLQPLTAVASVEQSSDLDAWQPVSASTGILTQTKKDEVLRSTVAIAPSARKLFFRLRIENGWKVSLSWNASSSPSVTGYYLHYGTRSGDFSQTLDVGNRVQAVMSLPLTTQTCSVVVTAYDSLGLQSPPSPEIKVRRKGKRSGGTG